MRDRAIEIPSMSDESMLTCWECESSNGSLVEVTFPAWPGRGPTVRLCLVCYRDCYLPLVVPGSQTSVAPRSSAEPRRVTSPRFTNARCAPQRVS